MLRSRVLDEIDWRNGKEFGGTIGVNIYFEDWDWEYDENLELHKVPLGFIEVYDVAFVSHRDPITVSFTIDNVHNINIILYYDRDFDRHRSQNSYFVDNLYYLYRKWNNNEDRYEYITPKLTNFKAYTTTEYYDLSHFYVEPYPSEEEEW